MSLARAPRPALRPFVKLLWAAAPGEARPGGCERMLPAGTAHLAIRLSGPPVRLFADEDDQVGRVLDHAVIGGPRSAPYLRDVAQPAASVGAELQPGAAPLLFGVSGAELAERHVALVDVWGAEAGALRERLQEARDPAQRLDVLEELLAARLPRVRGVHPAVAHALAGFARGEPVAALVEQTGYSHRHFTALFRDAVGLGPKVYCRVQRFGAVLARVAADRDASWAEIAYAAGYSDQPHLNREFSALAGLSPGQYRRAMAPGAPRHVPVR